MVGSPSQSAEYTIDEPNTHEFIGDLGAVLENGGGLIESMMQQALQEAGVQAGNETRQQVVEKLGSADLADYETA